MNNLLPKSEGQFSETAYWEKFFKARSNSFEWYGEYHSLINLFIKYVKSQDNVLVIGCGNSTLSEDLFITHKVNNVVSIDTSITAIDQMLEKNKKIIQSLSSNSGKIFDFLCVDASDMSVYESINRSMPISCVIDKGTTDAIHSGGEASSAVLESMWSAIETNLSIMGRYILITLAQSHIVDSIVQFFTKQKQTHGWMINVYEIEQKSFKLPVFAFVFYKMKPSASLPLVYVEENSFSGGAAKPQKTLLKRAAPQLAEWVAARQQLAMLCSSIRDSDRSETEINLESRETGLTRFRCFLVTDKGRQAASPFCVFVVPMGMHADGDYEGPRSRLAICRQCQSGSCLFVYLNPREHFVSKQSIQEELQCLTVRCCPASAPVGYSVPVLSSVEDVCGHSDHNRVISMRDEVLAQWVPLLPRSPHSLYIGPSASLYQLGSDWSIHSLSVDTVSIATPSQRYAIVCDLPKAAAPHAIDTALAAHRQLSLDNGPSVMLLCCNEDIIERLGEDVKSTVRLSRQHSDEHFGGDSTFFWVLCHGVIDLSVFEAAFSRVSADY